MKRIVSLLPAATEIVAALGIVDELVGVSHECDFPSVVNDKPRVTRCEIHDAGLPSAQVDDWVKQALASEGTLYTMDEDLLRRLAPDVIITQRLCDVCAVEYGSVAALAATIPGPPFLVNLEPTRLADIFDDIRRVGRAANVRSRAESVVAALESRVEFVRHRVRGRSRPTCVLVEWIDPLYRSGHWGPELVEIAGGVEPVGEKGKVSSRIDWKLIVESQPDVLIIACCGYDANRAMRDMHLLERLEGWGELPAVRNNRVHIANGSAYFSRPGPRVIDSLEIVAEIIHPGLFRDEFPDRGVNHFETRPPIPAADRTIR
jgi:iron complex transport system substrate-binding protein